jgi:hypothetical protein
LFISIRIAASCGHPLQVIVVPLGARMMRVAVVMRERGTERVDLRKRGERCQRKKKKFFT